MSNPSEHDMLEALGYVQDPEGIRGFQADYNRLGLGRQLEVTGQLDAHTRDALALAYPARAMLAVWREGGR